MLNNMTIGELFNELCWVKKIIGRIERDYNSGVVTIEEVKHAIKKLNNYLDFLDKEVENI